MTTGDDAFARTVDDIVASLRRDPVLVQQAMGNGHTQDAVAEIRERVDAADFPVYVALVHPPAGLEENDPLGDLTSILHQRIGGPGLYVVGNEHRVGVLGDLRHPGREARRLRRAGRGA